MVVRQLIVINCRILYQNIHSYSIYYNYSDDKNKKYESNNMYKIIDSDKLEEN